MTAFDALATFPHQAFSTLCETGGKDILSIGEGLAPAMRRGTALHQAGLPEYALPAFEQALEAARESAASVADIANAASALAAVLLQLGLSQAAYRCLLDNRHALEQSADGNRNLAVAAAAVGKSTEARASYAAALKLNAAHMPSLFGMSRLAAAEGLWDEALRHAADAAAQRPQEPDVHLHLIDTLLRARRPSDALRACGLALTRLPGVPALLLRQGIAQACLGAWERARQSLAGCDPAAAPVADTLRQLGLKLADNAPGWDVVAVYIQYAAQATGEAAWLYERALPDVVRALLRAPHAASVLAWRSARGLLQSLELANDEIAAVHAYADASLAPARAAPIQRSAAPVARGTSALTASHNQLRVGMFVPRLSDAGMVSWLQSQLAWHDNARFAIHIYAHTPQPEARWLIPLKAQAAQAVETAHMTDAELLARIRLDALDLLVDFSTDTADARPGVMAGHPARVMLRDGASFPNHPAAGPCDYMLSDAFVHADIPAGQAGAVVRLPFSSSIAPRASSLPAQALADAEDGMVRLGVAVPIKAVDPASFGAWMQILGQAPAAQLHFPAYPVFVQARLRRHAAQHQVESSRLHFAVQQQDSDGGLVPGLALNVVPHLLLDPVRRSAPRAVACALAAGIPALACAGTKTSSRAGAAILHAAGLADAVTSDLETYVQRGSQLAGNFEALGAMRERVAAARLTAPWWDAVARTREREAAWVQMIERTRAGQPPAAFDVQAAS